MMRTPLASMEKTSPFMLIFRETNPAAYQALSADRRQALLEQWNAWYDGLTDSGKVDHGHPLEPEGRIVSGARGERVVDGPFAEAKEAIGGYFFLQVANLDEATAIAQGCPNLPYGMQIEIRPVSECCHLGKVNGRATQRASARL